MPVTIEDIKENYLLIAFDISDDDIRREVREKLYELHAVMHTQSVYYVPDNVMTRDYIENWARREFGGIDIRVFELSPSDDRSKTFFHNKYILYIRDMIKEFKEIQNAVMEQLEDFEEDIVNEKKTDFRGFHRKIEGIDMRMEELRNLIEQFTDGKTKRMNEWNLQAIDSMNRRIKERVDKVKAMKLKVFSK